MHLISLILKFLMDCTTCVLSALLKTHEFSGCSKIIKFTPVIYKILRTAIFAIEPELAQGLSPCKKPACKVLRGFTKPVPKKGMLVAWGCRTIVAALIPTCSHLVPVEFFFLIEPAGFFLATHGVVANQLFF